MLGYVKGEVFDEEHEKRLRAEASLCAAETSLANAMQREGEAWDIIKEMRADHARQITEILETLKPKPPHTVDNYPVDALKDMTPDEIRAIPAHSRREMALREVRAVAAQVRLQEERSEKDLRERAAVLTPAEKRDMEMQYDDLLGIMVIKPPAAEGVTTQ